MIKIIAEKLLNVLGVEIVRNPTPQTPAPLPNKETGWQDVVGALVKDPLNPNLHLQYAIDASNAGACYLAFAELRTAEYLGADRERIESLLISYRNALPDPASMNHNVYFRLSSLASEIRGRAGRAGCSILDVGGSDGRLASFLPEAAYCLAEPAVNGISGTHLPFPDRSFDYVVSCHVLEHIPVSERPIFLDQLLSKSKRGVILLNPFHVEGTHAEERLKLFIEITRAAWAKEHLDCTLPNVEDIRSYASKRGLEICVKPNGTLTTSAAFVFIDYFAEKTGSYEELKKINAFFNEKFIDILDSPQYPNSYLIYLGLPETASNRAGQ